MLSYLFGITRRWEMMLMLMSGIVVVYTLRVNMSVACSSMKKDLGWTETEKGYILSSFYWGYACGMFLLCWVDIPVSDSFRRSISIFALCSGYLSLIFFLCVLFMDFILFEEVRCEKIVWVKRIGPIHPDFTCPIGVQELPHRSTGVKSPNRFL